MFYRFLPFPELKDYKIWRLYDILSVDKVSAYFIKTNKTRFRNEVLL